TSAEAPAGRAANGRFAAGNAFSAGNPFQRQLAARRRSLLEAVSDADIRAVGKKLVELALVGDVAAAKVLLPYVLGKPAKAADPDGLDADELKRLLAHPDAAGVLDALRRLDPAAVVEMAREQQAGGRETVVKRLEERRADLQAELLAAQGGDLDAFMAADD